MRKYTRVACCVLLCMTLVVGTGCGKEGAQGNPSESEEETGNHSQENTESQSETEGPTESEEETETQETKVEFYENGFWFVPMDEDMWTTSNLKVRSLPNTDGVALGMLAEDTKVHVTGQCKETGWYRIEYEQMAAYVSNDYVIKKEASQPNSVVDAMADVANGKTVHKAGSIYVIGNGAFEAYTFNNSRAVTYGQLVSQVAKELKGIAKVYCMPIPLSSGVMLPKEYKDKVAAGDQEGAIDSILKGMESGVVPVDVFGTLKEHSDEYLYFRTDHHWTQLGAYYAYTEFCKAKGVKPYKTDHFRHEAYEGFVGSFYFGYKDNYGEIVSSLRNSADTVYTYAPVSNAVMTVHDKNGDTYSWPIIKDVDDYSMGTKYSCFIAGDNPLTIIENKDITDGSSCIVVKESYGNAFVPLLVDHYETIYVIDQRYWDGNLISYAKEHKVEDILFANNLTAIGSKSQLASLNKIID